MQRPTETAEITIEKIWQPSAGKKWGNLQATNGNRYFGPPAMLANYAEGETCIVEYELGGNDGTLKGLKRKVTQAKNGGPAMPAQSAIVSASSPTYTKDEMIFVCGALNHMLGNQMVDPAKVTTAQGIATVNMLREVWAATFGQIPY